MLEGTEKFRPTVEIKVGKTLEDAERMFILATLNYCKYNRTKTGKMLKMGLRTLQRKLMKWGLKGFGLDGKYSGH